VDPSHEARYEDGIIAWVWRVFIETNGSDPTILLRLPMTKVSQIIF
jgi:PhoPQ-activated pathogenicity-related protein